MSIYPQRMSIDETAEGIAKRCKMPSYEIGVCLQCPYMIGCEKYRDHKRQITPPAHPMYDRYLAEMKVMCPEETALSIDEFYEAVDDSRNGY